jgi:hypothetical protein
MTGIGDSIISVFDYAWERITGRLEGLTDDEYFWEPVAGCWSLRRGDDGRWELDGGQFGHPPPDPAPVTTIAWRIGHFGGMAVGGFTNRLFGTGEMTVAGPGYPPHAAGVPAFLDAHYQRWRAGMAGLDAQGWMTPLGPSWGPYAEDKKVDLALHVLDEVVHHGAEVGLLRDLYPHRSTPRG